MPFFELGEVRPATDEDFMHFKNLATDNTGWKRQYRKKKTIVYTRPANASNIKMLRIVADLDNLTADALYDTLHDPDYRVNWDKTMKDGYEICRVAEDNLIEYYSIKSPFTLANRDFLLNRIWKESDGQYIIINRSVFHKKVPPKKGFIRALTFMTGYLIADTGPNSCQMIYITQNDLRGDIPAWVVNLTATTVAPSIMKTLHKAAISYSAWKANNSPQWMPWRNREQQCQMSCPPLCIDDILKEPDLSPMAKNERAIPPTVELESFNGSSSEACSLTG